MMFSGRSILLLCLSLVGASRASAWGDVGHGAIGLLAEQYLTPRAKAFVQSILGVEPLAVAATWPDHVRSDDRFKGFSPYHYLEIPEGQRYTDTLAADRVDSAHTLLSQAPGLLAGDGLTREQKMVLLRYFVHVAGDVHMPLHVGNGTDLGGNLCDVRWVDPGAGQERTINLHSLWDDGLVTAIDAEFQKAQGGGKRRWFGYRELAELVAADKEATKGNVKKLEKAPLLEWLAESRKLHSKVYPDGGKKPKAVDQRAYCRKVGPDKKTVDGTYDATKLPLLDEAYVAAALPIIKRQIFLAGRRLAHELNRIAEAAPPVQAPIDETAMLNALLLKEASPWKPLPAKSKR